MKRSWSTNHWITICLTLFALLISKSIQADVLHYLKLKKLLTAAVVAKALTHRRHRILPVPIPIPIPIQQNEVISLPSSVAKKMFIYGSGHQKHQDNTEINFQDDHFKNTGSSLYGSSTYGYPLTNKGRFNRGNGGKRFLSLSNLVSPAGLSSTKSVKVINLDSLTNNHNFRHRFPIEDSNVIDGKYFWDTHNQFPIDGTAGRLPMTDTQFYTNNHPFSGFHTNSYGNDYLGGYNPYMEQNIYPQTIRNPRRRRRKYPREKSFERKPVTQNSSHMKPTDYQNYPQTKRPPPPPEIEATVTVEVGDKMKYTE